MNGFLCDGPEAAGALVLLAHGAGGPMDSALLTRLAGGLGGAGHRVVRFEFPYMAARRTGGGRRPPDRTDVLLQCWREVAARWRDHRPLFLGGHSMGGRMATMVADELGAAGLVCVSYPWHPPGAPGRPRTEHLKALATPALLVCGTRDEFGTPEEVAGYALSPALRVHWLPGADHSLRAHARSGRTATGNIRECVDALDAFIRARAGLTAPAASPAG
ncbi:MAG: dienelactone hydrolase family protein [Deltaproteobacteria bacterium]|nr:dienelactone hydrolase family protein [Deltaproteobacteria bacterium]